MLFAYRSALYPVLQRINSYLVRWMRRKYKRLRSKKKALEVWWRVVTQYPGSLAHLKWTVNPWRTG